MAEDNQFRWYVMTHFDMKRFMEWLEAENAQRLSEERPIVESFYPHDFLKDAEGALSGDLIHVVFLKTTETDINSLVRDERNTVSYNRLRHYRDTDGHLKDAKNYLSKAGNTEQAIYLG